MVNVSPLAIVLAAVHVAVESVEDETEIAEHPVIGVPLISRVTVKLGVEVPPV